MQYRNTFSRTASNLEKMGAYYTDVVHCRDIGKMFRFPEGENEKGEPVECCVLEPSCGDGEAVIQVTGITSNKAVKLFGVELNSVVAEKTAGREEFEQLLNADFLEDFQCTNGAFTFAFGNPPYMDDEDEVGEKVRTERRFLEKISNYIAKDGILVWVIPYRIFIEDGYCSCWMGRYETLAFYKFREPEFSKFKQVVIVGRRRGKGSGAVMKSAREDFQNKYREISMVPELPDSFSEDEKIAVLPSYKDSIKEFRTRAYDADASYQYLKEHMFEDVLEMIDSDVTTPVFRDCISEIPPIPLKKDSLYLIATCGAGAGLTGTDGVDLHLQRGHVEVVEDVEIFTNQKTGKEEQVVTERSQISMVIVENSGRITKLM